MAISGEIVGIGVSGKHWIGGYEQSAHDMILESIQSAKNSIQITAYSLGEMSEELEDIFKILLLKINSGVKVQLIVNRLWSTSDYAKRRIKSLEHKNFTLLDYDPDRKIENLHAKILIIDSTDVIVGSANMSKSGMVANHEIMIKVRGGEFASKINRLVDILARSVHTGDKVGQ
ncbi:MAG: phospholipase D family protein [Alphaproteobacteria bacterium]|nr:phospholipase D family protein [Alphaproteobacteria bacterium]